MFTAVEDEDGLLGELLAFLDQEAATSPDKQAGSSQQSMQIWRPSPAENAALGAAPTPSPQLRAGAASSRASRSKRVRDADKVKELEAIAAAQMEHFEALVRRNVELKYKSAILSDVVTIRDLQLQIVKGEQPVPRCLPPGSAQAPGRGGVQGQGTEAPRTSVDMVWAPGSVRHMLDPQMMTPVDPASVRHVGRSELVARWKAFVHEASGLLLALEENPHDEATADRMRQVTADAGGFFRQASFVAHDAMLAFAQLHLETQEIAEPEPGLWPRVLATMRLTEEQLRDMRTVYGLFSSIMAGVAAERQVIHAQLARGLQAQQGARSDFKVSPEGEALPLLERNLRKEGSAHILLRGFLFGRTLSIVQMCRAVVHSYPFFPNSTALVAVAAGVVV